MKLNLNTHDIYALVTEFQFLIGSQVVNVYDINSQTICIKLRCKIDNNGTKGLTNHLTPLELVELDSKENEENEKKHMLKY